VAGKPVDQVLVGSCTNSSVVDLETVASMVRGRTVYPATSLAVSPGSKQALSMIAASGAVEALVSAGARMLDAGCGPCIGMGQSPASGAVSLRSFNRNFEGRSGTVDANVYLASAEVCVASALTGVITDPRTLGAPPQVSMPAAYTVNDNMIISPGADGSGVEVVRGPNIKALPRGTELPGDIEGELLLVMGDNITTDHIMPAGAQVLPLRSNVPALSNFALTRVDPTFPERARQAGGGLLLGGENYGQGSSREHAALVPMYLGVKAVIVKSFARIHMANLVNVGIVPLILQDGADHGNFAQGDLLRITGIRRALLEGSPVVVENVTQRVRIPVRVELSERQVQVLLAGGLLNYIKLQASEE